jgi:hypothetical protein
LGLCPFFNAYPLLRTRVLIVLGRCNMAHEIELIFRDRELDKLLRGKFRVDRGLVTVTAPDGRQKTAQLGGTTADTMARLMLHEMNCEQTR